MGVPTRDEISDERYQSVSAKLSQQRYISDVAGDELRVVDVVQEMIEAHDALIRARRAADRALEDMHPQAASRDAVEELREELQKPDLESASAQQSKDAERVDV